MAGLDALTKRLENTHRPSFGSEGALRGLGSNPAVEDLPPRRLGRGRRQHPRLHPLQGRRRCACHAARAPRMWPRRSSPASALWQDRIRAVRGPRPSSLRLSIPTLRDLLIPPACMCVRGRGEERERSTGGRSPFGTHSAEGRGSAKIACCVTWSQGCRCLMIASCLLYVWCVVCCERPSSEEKKGPFHVIVTFIAMVWDLNEKGWGLPLPQTLTNSEIDGV
jgi:hypothetical protein